MGPEGNPQVSRHESGTLLRSTRFERKCEESMIKPFRIAAALLIIGIVSVALSACGSGGGNASAPQDRSIVAVEPTVTTETVTAVTEPPHTTLKTTVDTPADTTALAAVDEPAKAPVETGSASDGPDTVDAVSAGDSVVLEVNGVEPDADSSTESALQTSYADYGFTLKLDLGAEVQAAGWTEPDPSLTQGIIAFTYGGVNTNLVWGPPEERTALTFLADTYNVLRASQPAVTFETISDGDLLISEQEGVYGGFKAVDNSGAALGGGLIGAWICGDSETAFRMTLTGEDATVVQLRFDRLLENFACSSS